MFHVGFRELGHHFEWLLAGWQCLEVLLCQNFAQDIASQELWSSYDSVRHGMMMLAKL